MNVKSGMLINGDLTLNGRSSHCVTVEGDDGAADLRNTGLQITAGSYSLMLDKNSIKSAFEGNDS